MDAISQHIETVNLPLVSSNSANMVGQPCKIDCIGRPVVYGRFRTSGTKKKATDLEDDDHGSTQRI